MASEIEINQLCRLCLVKEQVNVPIFEEEGDLGQIFLKISACLPVKISRDDSLPKKICDSCSCKLDVVYQFWNTSANSEKQLLKWLNQLGVVNTMTSVNKKNSDSQMAHSINTDTVINLKQEVVELAEHEDDDNMTTEEMDDSNDSENYMLQQQHIPYENFSFQDGFPNEEPSHAVASSTVTSKTVNTRPKRKRRATTKALQAQLDSDDEDDSLLRGKITKTEEQSDSGEDPEPTAFVGLPSTSTDDQPGPSGINKGNAEAPYLSNLLMPIITLKEIRQRESKMSRSKRDDASATYIPKFKIKLKKIKKDLDEEMKYVCHICKNDIKMTEFELKFHFKEEHKGKRLRSMKLHSENAVTCDICPKQFCSVKSLKEHMETHSNVFDCDTCHSKFRKLLDYIIHLRLHSPEEMFKCVLCDYCTVSINEITDHFNNEHDHNFKYKCAKCGKGFHVLTWFKEHENYHTGEKPFECQYCGKQFFYSRYLSAHKKSAHKEDLKKLPTYHECVICKKRYQHKNSLNLHMNVHTGNVAICEVCGKKLSSKEKLKFHMRTHTGYKPFSCTYCGKCFTKKPILVEHERIHTGEKPYTCEYCSKGFSQRSSMVIHLRGHTGEKPYVCHLCNKGFAARAMLNIHLKTCQGK